MTTTTCNAIKKDGKKCCFKSKPGSCFCGVHKNFIDTSKPLFTEDIEDEDKPEQMPIKFMDGSIIMVDKGGMVDSMINRIRTVRGNGNTEKYQLFKTGQEDALKRYEIASYDELFCLFEEVKERKFEEKQVLYIYSKGGVMFDYKSPNHPEDIDVEDYDKESQYTMCQAYEVIKRTRCYVKISSKSWFQQQNGLWWSSINTREYRVKIYDSNTEDEWFDVPNGCTTIKASQVFDDFGGD